MQNVAVPSTALSAAMRGEPGFEASSGPFPRLPPLLREEGRRWLPSLTAPRGVCELDESQVNPSDPCRSGQVGDWRSIPQRTLEMGTPYRPSLNDPKTLSSPFFSVSLLQWMVCHN